MKDGNDAAHELLQTKAHDNNPLRDKLFLYNIYI